MNEDSSLSENGRCICHRPFFRVLEHFSAKKRQKSLFKIKQAVYNIKDSGRQTEKRVIRYELIQRPQSFQKEKERDQSG